MPLRNVPKDYASRYLGKTVQIKIDRPKGSRHQKHGWPYLVNYGFVLGTLAPDGEAVDAYALGWDEPATSLKGTVVAVVHRLDDDDDKLIVVKDGEKFSEQQIRSAIDFQEKFFKYELTLAG